MTGGTTSNDPKKAVCKAFTRVVKSSPLPINPKTFFMMLNTNYAVLCQENRIDLGPLWDALVAAHPPEHLFGVFLMFRMRALDLGFRVLLPKAVDALTEDQMRDALHPYTGMSMPDEPTPLYDATPTPLGAQALPLQTSDLRPFVPEDLRREVVKIVSSAFRASPLGHHIDAAALTYQIDTSFEALFDGRAFDFSKVFGALRESTVLSDHDVYEVVFRARNELAPLQVDVIEPPLSLSETEKGEMVADLRRTQEKEAKEHAAISDQEPKKPTEESNKRATTREERLDQYGLTSVREKKLPIRAIVLAVVVASLAVVAIAFWPTRSLSTEPYDAIIPLESAELIQDVFQCVVDDGRWFALTIEERSDRMTRFQALLREEDRVGNMQCRDTHNRLVISDVGGNRIAGAPFFMKGDATGTVPAKVDPPPTEDDKT